MYRSVPIVCLIPALWPENCWAHSFGVIYTLPLPFWLYAWGAGAALIASFVIVGLLMGSGRRLNEGPAAPRYPMALPWFAIWLFRTGSLAALILSILSGWFGKTDPYANFNMTAFWIWFVLGCAYLSALIGDFFALINPWQAMARGLNRVIPGFSQGCLRLDPGYSLSLILFMSLIWVELLGDFSPNALSHLLAGYTLLNLIGVGLLGEKTWFGKCECFSVLFGLLARLAPVEISENRDGSGPVRFRFKRPACDLHAGRVPPMSLLLFILAMLASTAFDGLHETQLWHRFYWVWLYPNWLVDWVGSNPLAAFPKLREGYQWWQLLWLLLLPLIYLLAYLTATGIMSLIVSGAHSWMRLSREFALSLLPIALVYHLSHYYTLLQTQGPKIIPLLSDPFGQGHNWFGTANWFVGTAVPDVNRVWHIQVGLIVLGHIASVYLAHQRALELFGTRREAVISQLPMLLLMLAFTVAGLWILSQPFQGS